jgi:hypothetical protein
LIAAHAHVLRRREEREKRGRKTEVQRERGSAVGKGALRSDGSEDEDEDEDEDEEGKEEGKEMG